MGRPAAEAAHPARSAGGVRQGLGQHWHWAAGPRGREGSVVDCGVLRQLPCNARLRRVGLAYGAGEHVSPSQRRRQAYPAPPRRLLGLLAHEQQRGVWFEIVSQIY